MQSSGELKIEKVNVRGAELGGGGRQRDTCPVPAPMLPLLCMSKDTRSQSGPWYQLGTFVACVHTPLRY